MAGTTTKLVNIVTKVLGRKPARSQVEPASPEFQLRANPAVLTPKNTRFIMERVPIRWLSEGRITEADLALAATTPVLGQYAPTFGWPDDWGWYWEYLDAYIFIPEAAFAVKLKTRQVWKPGFEFDGGSKVFQEKLKKEWEKRKVFRSLWDATKNTLIWGNSYIESVDDSLAAWEKGSPADVAQGAAYLGNVTGAPRPLISYQQPSRFFGLKNTDPRTFRIQVHPQRWDPTPNVPPTRTTGVESDWDEPRSTIKIEKYIQRRWAGPLAPTALLGSETEIDFHPDQILSLQFNKITGGIYGYSTYRETLFALKGYLLMLQFLPSIGQKRADTTLHFRMGGDRFTETGAKVTTIPTNDEILSQKQFIENRMPGEDIYTDIFTTAEEVYKGGGGTERIDSYLQAYKERVLMGLGIPMTVATLAGGQEIKWGTLNFELMEDEIREYQQQVEDLVNDWVLPRLLLNLGFELGDGPEVSFHFNPITPEDWRANEAPLADLYQRGIISSEYVRDRLNIPDEAGKGSMAPAPQTPPKPLTDVPSGLPGGRGEKLEPALTMRYRVPMEKWRLKQTGKGVIAERMA